MTKITQVEGIGPAYSEKLTAAGIETTEQYIEKASKPAGRKELAATTGISGKLILTWANMIDLFRIKGIGSQYADLLEAAGVDTVPELAQRNAANLHAKMAEVNEEKKLVRQMPSADTVAKWVTEAKSLPRVIEY